MKKKIIYIMLLFLIITGVVVFFMFLNKGKKEENNSTGITGQRTQNSDNSQNDKEEENTIKKTLSDGVLYSLSNEEVKSDIVIGDNYFDTQINNMITNPSEYYGKNIEIEGFYLQSSPYTFVGRYSSNSLCPYCTNGYSYMEYVWEGEKPKLTEINSWIKVIGTLEKGNDETSYYQDFYYLKAISIEIMNERGQETAEN